MPKMPLSVHQANELIVQWNQGLVRNAKARSTWFLVYKQHDLSKLPSWSRVLLDQIAEVIDRNNPDIEVEESRV